MRYFYSICFLVFGAGFPVLAKSVGTDNPTAPTTSKVGSREVLPSKASAASGAALAKSQILKKSEFVLTPDSTRGSISAALLAKQDSSATPAVVRPAAAPAAAVVHSPAHTANPTPLPVVRNSTNVTYGSPAAPLRTASGPVSTESDSFSEISRAEKRLARVTAYWSDEGDYYTGRGMSATGVRLHDGLCAVDPNIIPYGSVVQIDGVGKYLAVDTGSAVIERTAAREGGHTHAERSAIVVDIYFEDRSEGERFAASAAKYVSITWWKPNSVGVEARAARSLFAEENWTKIQSKQL